MKFEVPNKVVNIVLTDSEVSILNQAKVILKEIERGILTRENLTREDYEFYVTVENMVIYNSIYDSITTIEDYVSTK